MATSARHQDLPPEGGYRPINYARIPAKKYFGGPTVILGYVGVTAVAGYVYYLTWKKVRQDSIEMRSAKLALTPLLMAERDRECIQDENEFIHKHSRVRFFVKGYLKQLRRNRDEEAKLMANVPGWVVGTWYGDPVYKTLPPDTLVTPHISEFYAHGREREYRRRVNFQFWI